MHRNFGVVYYQLKILNTAIDFKCFNFNLVFQEYFTRLLEVLGFIIFENSVFTKIASLDFGRD